MARQFTPRAVRDHEDHVRQVVTEILDAVGAARASARPSRPVASRLPAMMIAELLGYPPELWEKVRYWSEAIMYGAGQTNPDGVPQTFGRRLGGRGDDCLRRRTWSSSHARRADPRDDLISIWVHTEQGGEPWTDGKILSESLLVLDGGAETTRTVIGSMIRELALAARPAPAS